MATFTQAPVLAYAHCRDARCPGYAQQQIDAIREEASYTFGDGDRLGAGVLQNTIERSHVEYHAADDADVPCPACGASREVTGTPRPQYVNESGHDPMGLLALQPDQPGGPVDPLTQYYGPTHVETDEEMETRLRGEIREEQMRARLRAEMGET
jgi:hypothetical protein